MAETEEESESKYAQWIANSLEVRMTAQELIARVLEKDGGPPFTDWEDAAPILARMLQKAIEQRDAAYRLDLKDVLIHPRYHGDVFADRVKRNNAELDRIAKGEK